MTFLPLLHPSDGAEPEEKMAKDGKVRRARVQVEFRKGFPPVYRYYQGATDEELAAQKETKRREYRREIERQRNAAEDAGAQFAEVAESWLRLYKAPHLRPSSLTMYRSILDVHILPAFGDRDIRTITRSEIQAFLNGKAGASASLLTKLKATLTQIFGCAEDDRLIDRSPMVRIRVPAGKSTPVLPVPLEAVPALVRNCARCRDGLLPLLLLYTGLRRGEALALQWRDVGADSVTVRQALTFINNRPVIGLPKTAAGLRTVPLLPDLAAVLPPRGAPDAFVFGGSQPYTESRFQRAWERIQRDVPELRGVHPHQLRHTYADILRAAGVNALTAQYLLGHEDYETTANVYSKVNTIDVTLAREQLLRHATPCNLPPETQKSRRLTPAAN